MLLDAATVIGSSGVALLLLYRTVGMPVFPGLLLAHCVIGMPYGFRTVLASAQALDPALEEAGQSLGAFVPKGVMDKGSNTDPRTLGVQVWTVDADADARRTWDDVKSGEKREFTVRWILQHVIEHEAHHRGQIFLLKRALGF